MKRKKKEKKQSKFPTDIENPGQIWYIVIIIYHLGVFMKYCVCPSYIWTYPDIHSYPEESESANVLALRGGYASFQVHIFDSGRDELSLSYGGFEWEAYEGVAIPVESCPGIENPIPHFPERKAPFEVFDCLKPIEHTALCKNGVASLYFAIKVPIDAPAESELSLTVSNGEASITVPVKIRAAASLPDEPLDIAMECDYFHMAKYHKIENREDFLSTQTQYMELLRRQHQTVVYLRPPYCKREGDIWKFDFTHFNAFAKKAFSMGFRRILIHGIGFRRSWDAPDIYCRDIDLLSLEGYKFLECYLKALRENLKNEGWLERDLFAIGLCDEPNDVNAMPYRALAGTVRKLFPEIKLYDATSGSPIYGALDIWVPRADEYEKHREVFDHYKNNGDSVWHYVCLYPREGGYINRFLDIPLLATRYLFWGNYKYGLTGYIHWTVNSYQDDCDPFSVSCPHHVNAGSESILPPGDDKLIYPGRDGRPWMSIRLENHRESAEEYAMLLAISKKDKALADGICEKVFRAFNDTELSASAFGNVREELIRAYERVVFEK